MSANIDLFQEHDAFWRRIESFLRNRTLIPVLGRSAITFGDDDQPLYPWLIREVAARLGVATLKSNGVRECPECGREGMTVCRPASLNELVCRHLAKNSGNITDVCFEIEDILSNHAPPPGKLLRTLASLSQCRAFFTLGCDDLLEQALREVRGYNRKPWVFAMDRKTEDLAALEGAATTLGYLFGKASPNPGFHLWDADALEFVWQLKTELPSLKVLARTFAENNLLIIGADMSDWAVRFLIRAIRQNPLTEGSGKPFFLADSSPPNTDDTVIFYDSLKRGISVIRMEPIAFARRFCKLALSLEQPVSLGSATGQGSHLPLMDIAAPDGSIFVSYSHKDDRATFRIVEKLREHGCIVWLDTERLVCGDDFENHLEHAVMKKCGFFISVISQDTESRTEAYFHKERKWAEKRCESIPTHVRPFYFPVVVDGTSLPTRNELPAFANIDCERAERGEISDTFAKTLAEYQRRLLTTA